MSFPAVGIVSTLLCALTLTAPVGCGASADEAPAASADAASIEVWRDAAMLDGPGASLDAAPHDGSVRPSDSGVQDAGVDAQLPGSFWSKRFGDAQDQQGSAVAAGPAGEVFVAGKLAGSIEQVVTPLSATSAYDGFLAKLDPSGESRWALALTMTPAPLGTQGYLSLAGIASDATGGVYVAGDFVGVLRIAGITLSNPTSRSASRIFVAHVDAAGALTWAKAFGAEADTDWSSNDQHVTGVAADPSGNVLLGGTFAGAPLDFGGAPLSASPSGSSFVAKLSPSGHRVASRAFASRLQSTRVASDAAGNILLTGMATQPFDLGGGTRTGAIVAAKLDATGAHVWSHGFGSTPSVSVGRHIAADPAGNVVLTGAVAGTVDFGGGPLTTSGPALGNLFVAKLSADGAHLWSKRFDADDVGIGDSIAVDGSGAVVVSGSVVGSIDFGGGTLPPAGRFADVVVAKLDADGEFVWGKRVGDAGEQKGLSVATDASGAVLLAGYFYGAVDFGFGALTSAGGSDAYLARLAP